MARREPTRRRVRAAKKSRKVNVRNLALSKAGRNGIML